MGVLAEKEQARPKEGVNAKNKEKTKSNDGAILRLIELPAIIGKVERGSGLEGKITSSALDKLLLQGLEGQPNSDLPWTTRNMR